MASLDSPTVNDWIECVSMAHLSFRITLAKIAPTGVILFIHILLNNGPEQFINQTVHT